MAVFVVLASWILVILGFFLFALSKWNGIRYKSKGLPQGTMGWPVFGETIDFLKKGPDFMNYKRSKYGDFFKTHILGSPMIISTDPELNRYILMSESKGLVPGYPQSNTDILGPSNIAAVQGSIHKYIRGSLLSVVNPAMLKDQLLSKLDKCTKSFVENLDAQTIDLQESTKEMAFYVAFNQVLEKEANSIYADFKSEFDKVAAGAISLPINIPGTMYYYGLQGRKNAIRILKRIMKERRNSSIVHDDMFAQLMGSEDSKYHLSDEEIFDQVFTILYSGYETVSITTMMAVKYLHDHPEALEKIREEHFAIRDGKKPGELLDWDDYKSMTFTRAVIYETSRLATIVNGVLRKTFRNVELNGFVIPQGWRIYVYTREINYDPVLYPEPLSFNPWRWLDKSLESHKYCFLFGAGTRLCPGKELGLVKIAIFLHHFVTKYRWEEIAGQEIRKFPRVEAPEGLHVKLSKY
ncbi:hypothetical protein ACFE04_022436 [Oxalis oulophora]